MKTKKISGKTNKIKGVRHRNRSRRVSMKSLKHCTIDARFGWDDSRDIIQKVIKMHTRGSKVRIRFVMI